MSVLSKRALRSASRLAKLAFAAALGGVVKRYHHPKICSSQSLPGLITSFADQACPTLDWAEVFFIWHGSNELDSLSQMESPTEGHEKSSLSVERLLTRVKQHTYTSPSWSQAARTPCSGLTETRGRVTGVGEAGG